jgi:hypothetical protein
MTSVGNKLHYFSVALSGTPNPAKNEIRENEKKF